MILCTTPNGIGLRHPAEVVEGPGPVALAGGVDFVDGDDLALLRLLDHVVVVKSPPCRGVAAKAFALVNCGLAQGRGFDVQNAHFQDVARLGAFDGHGPGADVHAQSLARAAPEQRGVHRPGAAAFDALARLVPVEDAFRPGIALDHALEIVVCMMRERLDRDEVAGVDFDQRLQVLAEVAPMHGLVGGRDMVMLQRAALWAGLRLGQ